MMIRRANLVTPTCRLNFGAVPVTPNAFLKANSRDSKSFWGSNDSKILVTPTYRLNFGAIPVTPNAFLKADSRDSKSFWCQTNQDILVTPTCGLIFGIDIGNSKCVFRGKFVVTLDLGLDFPGARSMVDDWLSDAIWRKTPNLGKVTPIWS